MRQPRDTYRQFVAGIDAEAASGWMPCLLTDLATDAQGRADLTPFCAPSGKQNLRTFFDKPLTAVRNDPSLLNDALSRWRRVEGFTGEYLDHHAINSAADHPAGKAGAERGVPGATWLATMALPLLRLAGDGQKIEAALWHQIARRRVMIWPLWHEPLDRSAVKVMIEHPCLTPDPTRSTPAVASHPWPALKIFAVYGAERERIQGRKFPGVLAPITIDLK